MTEQTDYEGFTRIGPFFKTTINSNKRYIFAVCECKKCGEIVCKRKKDLNRSKSCGCGQHEREKLKIFNDTEVTEILQLAKEGMSATKISKIYHCSHKTIIKYLKKFDFTFVPRFDGQNNPRWQGVGDLSKTYFNRIEKGAKDRNLDFDIDIESMWNLFLQQDGKCALTGLDLLLGHHRKQTGSLDRIDSTMGYTKNNVQWIHKHVNIMKGNIPQDVFIEMCHQISKHNLLIAD